MALLDYGDSSRERLAAQIRAQYGGEGSGSGNWDDAGYDRALELADLLLKAGITDLGELSFKDLEGDRWEAGMDDQGNALEGAWSKGVLGRQLMIGDEAVGYLGDYNNDGSYGNKSDSVLKGVGDEALLGWSARGDGNTSYRVITDPETGKLVIAPGWNSSSDAKSFQNAGKFLAATAAAGYGITSALGGGLGAGTGAASVGGGAGGSAAGGAASGGGITFGGAASNAGLTIGGSTATGLGTTGLGATGGAGLGTTLGTAGGGLSFGPGAAGSLYTASGYAASTGSFLSAVTSDGVTFSGGGAGAGGAGAAGAGAGGGGGGSFLDTIGGAMKTIGITGGDLLKLGAGGISAAIAGKNADEAAERADKNRDEDREFRVDDREDTQVWNDANREDTQAFTSERDNNQNDFTLTRDNNQNAFTTARDETQRGYTVADNLQARQWQLDDRTEAEKLRDRLERERMERYRATTDMGSLRLVRNGGLLNNPGG